MGCWVSVSSVLTDSISYTASIYSTIYSTLYCHIKPLRSISAIYLPSSCCFCLQESTKKAETIPPDPYPDRKNNRPCLISIALQKGTSPSCMVVNTSLHCAHQTILITIPTAQRYVFTSLLSPFRSAQTPHKNPLFAHQVTLYPFIHRESLIPPRT